MNDFALARRTPEQADQDRDRESPAGSLKASLISAFCHDCRTPLAVIADSASIVREELEDEGFGSESIEFLDGITERAVELENLLADLRFLHAQMTQAASPDAAANEIEAASFAELLADVSPQLEKTVASLGHSLSFQHEPDLPFGRFEPTVMARALTSAVTELCRPANTGATLCVTAGFDPGGEKIRISVERMEKDAVAGGGALLPLGSGKNEPADEEELRFRLQVVSGLVRLSGGQLVTMRGSAHRALTIFLPVSSAKRAAWPADHRFEGETHRGNERGHGWNTE
ncbi:MAG: hypothetical protein KDJ90_12890 [Nitratireductor sp.]|nr:hypothetical protein [Nitratireductor sp.]